MSKQAPEGVCHAELATPYLMMTSQKGETKMNKLYFDYDSEQAVSITQLKEEYCKQIMDGDIETSISFDEYLNNCTDMCGTLSPFDDNGIKEQLEDYDIAEEFGCKIQHFYRELSSQYLAKEIVIDPERDADLYNCTKKISSIMLQRLLSDYEKLYK